MADGEAIVTAGEEAEAGLRRMIGDAAFEQLRRGIEEAVAEMAAMEAPEAPISPRHQAIYDLVRETPPDDDAERRGLSERVANAIVEESRQGYIDLVAAVRMNRHVINYAMARERIKQFEAAMAELASQAAESLGNIATLLREDTEEFVGPAGVRDFSQTLSAAAGQAVALLGAYDDWWVVLDGSYDGARELGAAIDAEAERRGEWTPDGATSPRSSGNDTSAAEGAGAESD